jgi:poly-gamma-glutamate capsule biosynthesis protein CapA/YwtB (metallophosphatase superfamily)
MPTRLARSVWIAIVIATTAFLAAGCNASTPAVTLAPETATSTPMTEPRRSSGATAVPVAEDQEGSITIGFVGDLMFARDIVTLMQSRGAAYPFERVRPLLAGFDLLVGNLEGTFTDRGEPLVKTYTFRAPPPLASTLVDAGFDAVSLGNNHAFDFGSVGLRDTLATLEAAGIPWFGAGEDEVRARAPLILEAAGRPVALLGYSGVDESGFASGASPGVARASVETIATDVAAAVEAADYVIVVLHAGIEYTREPSAWQQSLAHAAIDAGADVVIGHHPHVLQPSERYGEGLILYSLGNFVFDLDADDLATMGSGPFETAVAAITLAPGARPEVRFRPAYIDPLENRPRLPTAEEARDVLQALSPLDR